MKSNIMKYDSSTEFYFDEGCYITEVSNSADDPSLSIARARVEPGRTTRWHKLSCVVERYVVIEGDGLVEVGDRCTGEVSAGDVVVIPANERQRITNTGDRDLVFLAICSPRFTSDVYIDCD